MNKFKYCIVFLFIAACSTNNECDNIGEGEEIFINYFGGCHTNHDKPFIKQFALMNRTLLKPKIDSLKNSRTHYLFFQKGKIDTDIEKCQLISFLLEAKREMY
jgi:hypothetical protein